MSDREDPNHFEQLVLDHIAVLYAVALKLTRNPDDAQRLTQSALTRAFRFRDSCKDAARIKTWLLTMLRNTFITEYRPASRWSAGPQGTRFIAPSCGEAGSGL